MIETSGKRESGESVLTAQHDDDDDDDDMYILNGMQMKQVTFYFNVFFFALFNVLFNLLKLGMDSVILGKSFKGFATK